jgi:2-polyprenyl-6-methoxyphenol hydroxylase-like FAD-dependent oxidoreductase
MSSPSNIIGSHAIVIGGGMAGLLSAHVLTTYFERVSLIERDSYPEEPIARAGVPQGKHVHIMLVRGQQLLETFFPGIKDKLIAQGAIESDFAADYGYYFPAVGWVPRAPSSLKGYVCTRPLLEWQVRQEVMASKRVQVIEKHEVVNLLASSDKRVVTGIQMRARNNEAPAEREIVDLEADLVVDTSGRDSPFPSWLESLGYMAPPETVINPFFGYSSRIYIPSQDATRTWKGLLVQANPPHNLRGGVIWPIEGGNWMVVLGGTGKDYPPNDADSFLEFARSIPTPLFYDALKDAQPLSPIYGYRRTANRLRHVERLKRLPERFIALGDAVCAFNPVYGQGMTIAALGAMTLDECLTTHRRKGLDGLPRYFQRKLAKINETPWQLATASDYHVPGIEGMHPSWIEKLTYRYIDNVVKLLPTVPLANKTFISVLHMIKPPAALFHPGIVARVLLSQTSFNRTSTPEPK